MKYSVLMSVYIKDDPSFLKLALESIYDNQTRKPDEIVIVFDGALTEQLHKVLNDFISGKEDKVLFYPLDKNYGLGEALRRGTKLCTGDYIFRMDSDDISLPTRFEKQIEYIEKNPEVDVLGTKIAEFEFSTDEEMRHRVCPKKHGEIVKMAKRRNPMNHMTVCIKKSALEKSGGYETMLLMEDYYLWVRMIACGCRLENLDEILVNVRIGNGFDGKRSSSVRINSSKQIQKFMLKNKQINIFVALFNMICIIGFTYCPRFIRRFAYKRLLRKN